MSPRGRSRSTTMPKMPHMRSLPLARGLLPPSAEGAVERDDRVQLVPLGARERVLRGEELLLSVDDLEVRREPGEVADFRELDRLLVGRHRADLLCLDLRQLAARVQGGGDVPEGV